MDVEEICALPVGKLAQKDCVLWLWTTNAFMREAYQCLDAWGFQAKTILTWDKERLGLGDWLRNVTEHCILAVKGKPVVSLTNQTTIIRAPRREHSRKPDEFYALVNALCPGSKLEMFARTNREGWSAWGAETEKFDASR
jgi:N6-adenosine-specific RNA methylase IME4